MWSFQIGEGLALELDSSCLELEGVAGLLRARWRAPNPRLIGHPYWRKEITDVVTWSRSTQLTASNDVKQDMDIYRSYYEVE